MTFDPHTATPYADLLARIVAANKARDNGTFYRLKAELDEYNRGALAFHAEQVKPKAA